MTGLKDYIYQYKDKVSDYIDDLQSYISDFMSFFDQFPDLMELTAGEEVHIDEVDFADFKDFIINKIANLQLMVPDDIGNETTAIKCSDFHIVSSVMDDNFKLIKKEDPDDPGSEEIDILWTATNTIEGGYTIYFSGWDPAMPNFDDVLGQYASSFSCHDLINQALELLDQGTLDLNTWTSMLSSKYDKLTTDAKLIYNNIAAALTVAGPTNLLCTVWQVIRGTFSGWENAEAYDGSILFNKNDYSVSTSYCLPFSTIVKGATAILSTVASIIHPIAGAIVAGVSAVGSAVVQALELNESNEFKFAEDGIRDNDCYSVPIFQYKYLLSDDEITIPTQLINFLSKYGKAKLVSGFLTVYAWIGDNIPYDENIPFSSICFEGYFSMLSGSEYLLSDPYSFVSNIESAFNFVITGSSGFGYETITIDFSTSNNLSISNFITNMSTGFGTKDAPSSFNPPMGKAPDIQEQDFRSQHRTVIRRLLMNTILFLYQLACVNHDYPITETVAGVTHTLFDCNFSETIYTGEHSKWDPYVTDYNYEYLKSIVPHPIDRFNMIISRFLLDCYDNHQQHFTFAGMPSAFGHDPWQSEAAVIAAVVNNFVIPCIIDVFKHANDRALSVLEKKNFLGLFFIVSGNFPATEFNYTNGDDFLNGVTNDYITIPGISNSANPYCIPPKYTINLWVRVALTAFVVVSVAVATLIIKSRVKRAISRKAYQKSNIVREKADKFKADMTTANFNDYYKAQRRYNRWWGKLSGLAYDGMNDWYSSSYDLAGGTVVSSLFQWAREQADQNATTTNSNVNSKISTTNSKIDSTKSGVDTAVIDILSLRRLIKSDDPQR